MTDAVSRRYSTGAIIFHWLIALAVIVNWRIAESAEHLPDTEAGAVMNNHFALGIVILVLTVLRIVWRLTHTPPPLAESLKSWEKALARGTHALFYILLIALPLAGWIGLSGYDATIDFWGMGGLGPLPVGFGKDTGHEILEVHGTGGSIVIYLMFLHILGALKHSFFDKVPSLSRMWPGKG